MSYALFAHRKIVLTGELNSVSLQQTQRSNEQYLLATKTTSLQRELSAMQEAQSLELSELYEALSAETNSDTRTSISNVISAKQAGFDSQLSDINNEIYRVSIKENAIEMEVKRLDTRVSALQKQLEAVEQAESSAIDRATPKFKGVG